MDCFNVLRVVLSLQFDIMNSFKLCNYRCLLLSKSVWFVSSVCKNSVVQSILKIYVGLLVENSFRSLRKQVKINHHLHKILIVCSKMSVLIWHLVKVVHMFRVLILGWPHNLSSKVRHLRVEGGPFYNFTRTTGIKWNSWKTWRSCSFF